MLRFLKPGLGAAVFGVRLLIAFAAPPLSFAAFAHELIRSPHRPRHRMKAHSLPKTTPR